jgi:hypothetical protein
MTPLFTRPLRLLGGATAILNIHAAVLAADAQAFPPEQIEFFEFCESKYKVGFAAILFRDVRVL